MYNLEGGVRTKSRTARLRTANMYAHPACASNSKHAHISKPTFLFPFLFDGSNNVAKREGGGRSHKSLPESLFAAPSAVEHPRVKSVVQALHDVLHRVDLGRKNDAREVSAEGGGTGISWTYVCTYVDVFSFSLHRPLARLSNWGGRPMAGREEMIFADILKFIYDSLLTIVGSKIEIRTRIGYINKARERTKKNGPDKDNAWLACGFICSTEEQRLVARTGQNIKKSRLFSFLKRYEYPSRCLSLCRISPGRHGRRPPLLPPTPPRIRGPPAPAPLCRPRGRCHYRWCLPLFFLPRVAGGHGVWRLPSSPGFPRSPTGC